MAKLSKAQLAMQGEHTMNDFGDYEGYTYADSLTERAFEAPKMTKGSREDAERYRKALVSHHEQIQDMQNQCKVSAKQLGYLKAKRKEDAQHIYTLKQQIKKLQGIIDEHQKHVEIAAGELRVSVPAPGSELALVLRAFRRLRYENEEIKEELSRVLRKVVR